VKERTQFNTTVGSVGIYPLVSAHSTVLSRFLSPPPQSRSQRNDEHTVVCCVQFVNGLSCSGADGAVCFLWFYTRPRGNIVGLGKADLSRPLPHPENAWFRSPGRITHVQHRGATQTPDAEPDWRLRTRKREGGFVVCELQR